jgi:hypothetical protein
MMFFPAVRLRLFCFLLLPIAPMLSGCGSLLTAGTADVAGVAGAGIANAVTKSAAVATGIGLGVAAGANAGLQYAERRVHGHEQDRIAEVAGLLPPGVVGPWNVVHDVAIEPDEHGELVVTRTIGNGDFACRELVFSVESVRDHQPQRAFYTATVCRDGARWRWASAEPATERWGSLQ